MEQFKAGISQINQTKEAYLTNYRLKAPWKIAIACGVYFPLVLPPIVTLFVFIDRQRTNYTICHTCNS